MAEELVRLTNQNDEMEEKVKEIPKLKVQLKVRPINLKNRLYDKQCNCNLRLSAEVVLI